MTSSGIEWPPLRTRVATRWTAAASLNLGYASLGLHDIRVYKLLDGALSGKKEPRCCGLAGAIRSCHKEEIGHADDIFSFLSAFYRPKNNEVAASIKNMFNEAVTWHC